MFAGSGNTLSVTMKSSDTVSTLIKIGQKSHRFNPLALLPYIVMPFLK